MSSLCSSLIDDPLQSSLLDRVTRKRCRVSSMGSGSTNVTLQEHVISRDERADILGKYPGFRGCTIWFTGLSGAGKTTISFALERALNKMGVPCYGLDGDNVRHGLCKNLGFSKMDRSENIRRVAEVAKLFADMGIVTLASFISPFNEDREGARDIHTKEGLNFIEVYVSTPLEVCESRDPKKLYKKARAGEITGFTGIDSAYEPPEKPELVIDTGKETPAESVRRVLEYLRDISIIPDEAIKIYNQPEIRELFANDNERQSLIEQIPAMPRIDIGLVDLQWLQVLSEGWATPLYGFMRERQYLQSLHFGQLLDLKKKVVFAGEHDDGCRDEWVMDSPVNQSIPIVLPITDLQKTSIMEGAKEVASSIALFYNDSPVAVLSEGEVFPHRKEERVARQFGFTDPRHPTIGLILASGEWCLGGDVLERVRYNDGLDEFRKTPTELRKAIEDKGADAAFVFQLRNPIHNGHALLMQDTRQKLLANHRNPVLLLHPLGGWTKDDDVPLGVRIRQHAAVIDAKVLDPDWTILSIFPSPMLYAGPTEVQWHARARIAAGVQTYIVGRDPAGIQHPDTKDFLYEPTHGAKAHKMIFFDESRKEDFDFISGTRMRTLARTGQLPPDGFLVPAAWQILADYYKSLNST
ncbi:hypothetical protein WR25_09256 [Diploscapter pachys]|uniref:adenylyl-sulfate kinase n=1 Tax=Diploscapter pachys TaxID=2018661 RepID=A0A2A2M051_9BILA|nr:hypothetical protein WR25_09256 [Diploscapter pachys]